MPPEGHRTVYPYLIVDDGEGILYFMKALGRQGVEGGQPNL